MKKNLLIILGVIIGVVAFAATIFFLIIRLTSPLTESVDMMARALQDDRFEEASLYLAESLLYEGGIEAMEELSKTHVIKNYEKARWFSRSIENNRGELDGSFITNTGGVNPVFVKLVKEHGMWKIRSMSFSD